MCEDGGLSEELNSLLEQAEVRLLKSKMLIFH